jgi:hypothetical protein
MHAMHSESEGDLHWIHPNLVGSSPVSPIEVDKSLLSDVHLLDVAQHQEKPLGYIALYSTL